jgi:5-methylcytosine-specific restriction endonuclease McrA
MHPLPRPTDDPTGVFLQCIDRIRDPDRKNRLAAVAGDVGEAAHEYEDAAAASEIHTLPHAAGLGEQVTTDDLVFVYSSGMVRPNAPGRVVYDKLIAAAAHGRCPLCGHGVVKTLDHHLPKSTYPALSVVPSNLIPVCPSCNKQKGDRTPNTAAEQTIHPYFDDIDGHIWLHGEVIQTAPPSVTFSVKPPNNWNDDLKARVQFHFGLFSLAELYAEEAAVEYEDIREYLTGLFNDAGTESVRRHLAEQAASRTANSRNSWKAATYRAWAASQWFWSGGFI